jgi:hypothetical protein
MNVAAIVDGILDGLPQKFTGLVKNLDTTGLSPATFLGFLSGLKALLNEIGREAFVATISQFDETAKVIEHGGQQHRFKMDSEKDWLTPFGAVSIERGYYQPDQGGQGVVPLDVRCGMVDRYMTPDLEEHCAFAATMILPKGIHDLFAKMLPQAPSIKAIQRVIGDSGGFAEANAEEVELAMRQQAPLSQDGDKLVVSWDGKPVPLREKGTKPGRPPERPGIRDGSESPTSWKEAGVATVSIYGDLSEVDGQPIRIDARYLARMPEPGMATLQRTLQSVVEDLLVTRAFAQVAVICDGKRSIWNTASQAPVFHGATFILDFYHAAQHLSKAAEAIFGKDSAFATKWFKDYRERMQLESEGTRAAIRSMRYYRHKLRRESHRRLVVTRVIRFFTRNLTRMKYVEFLSQGLPIGSGPVEAACKTLVGARLVRSGMRWSRRGGQLVLNLRAHYLSNRWDVFWKTYLASRVA